MTKLKLLTVGVAGIVLSGCSFFGLGGDKSYDTNYAAPATYAASTNDCCGKSLSRLNLEGGLGAAFIVGGDAVTGESANGAPGDAIRDISFNEAYQTGVRGDLGLSYALAPNTKVLANGFYQEHDSEGQLDWGTSNGAAVTGALSDYTSYGAELGLRQYGGIAPAPLIGSIRPYIEGRVGATRVDSIEVQNAAIGDTLVGDLDFYDGSWTPTASGLIGVETTFIGRSTIGLETGIRYTHELDADNSDIVGTPLAATNNGGDNWTIPLTLRGRYRF